MNHSSDEETDNPLYADRRNFYKVEKWSRDALRGELLIYAGNNLDKARRILERTNKHRPRIRIRQRMRVVMSGHGTKRSSDICDGRGPRPGQALENSTPRS
jgi:hypothetical protein